MWKSNFAPLVHDCIFCQINNLTKPPQTQRTQSNRHLSGQRGSELFLLRFASGRDLDIQKNIPQLE